MFIVGPPGSGKTTQGRILAASLGVTHISIGEEIRRLRAGGTKLSFDRKTGLLTQDATRTLLAPLLTSTVCAVIDGIPRSPEQVPMLIDLGIKSAIVIKVEIDFPTAMSRMRGRGREGEDPGVIAMRHSDHQRRSQGLLETCQDASWRVVFVDGAMSIQNVSNNVIQAFNEVREGGG